MATTSKSAWLTPTVLSIALASLLNDACYEAIIPLIPALLTAMGGGAAILGVIEGAADLVATAFKLWGGVLADVSPHRRPLAAGGYLGVGVLMPAIAFAHSPLAIGLLRSGAWASRGFRGPIRDTLLVEGTDPNYVNRAFGFQRALDTLGSALGPAVAIALITWGQMSLRNVIMLALIPGVGAAVMYLFVTEKARKPGTARNVFAMFRDLSPDFRRFLLASGTFGFGNFSASLLVLVAIHAMLKTHDARSAVALATALYLLRNTVQAICTYPAGVLSERFGSGRLLVVGFALIGAAYAALAFWSTSILIVAGVFVVEAIGTAIIEPNEGTFATRLLEQTRRGTGYGALAAVNGVGDFVSSAGIGALWQFKGPVLAFGCAALLCLGGALLQALLERGAHVRPLAKGD